LSFLLISYTPLITKPTRITQHTATIIDNIFTNNIEKLENSINGIIFSDISDHLPIIHKFDSNNHKVNESGSTKQSNLIYKRVINNSNITSFSDTIKNISWENVLVKENPTESFNEFSKSFKKYLTSNYKNSMFLKPITKNEI
jgi:hypothetical protein